jgi:nudix-type nucleoside diphosphatase (YffH/AdpP family)
MWDSGNMKRVLVESRKRILDDFFKVEEAHVRFEQFDGHMSPTVRRLNFERGDSVAAVLYNVATDQIILVDQFKYPTYEKGPGWITEVIAGMIDPGESPEIAVRREVLEEVGYSVTKVEHISTFYVSPGGSSERIFLYYAEVHSEGRTAAGGGKPSENEDIRTISVGLDEALRQVRTGEIADAKTILGLYWAASRHGKGL